MCRGCDRLCSGRITAGVATKGPNEKFQISGSDGQLMFPLANLTMPMQSSHTGIDTLPQTSSKSAFPTPFGISAAARFTAPTTPGVSGSSAVGTKLAPLPAASFNAGAASKPPPTSFVAPAKPASGSACVTPVKAVNFSASLSQRKGPATAASSLPHAASTGNSFLLELSLRRLTHIVSSNKHRDGTEVLFIVALTVV